MHSHVASTAFSSFCEGGADTPDSLVLSRSPSANGEGEGEYLGEDGGGAAGVAVGVAEEGAGRGISIQQGDVSSEDSSERRTGASWWTSAAPATWEKRNPIPMRWVSTKGKKILSKTSPCRGGKIGRILEEGDEFSHNLPQAKHAPRRPLLRVFLRLCHNPSSRQEVLLDQGDLDRGER